MVFLLGGVLGRPLSWAATLGMVCLLGRRTPPCAYGAGSRVDSIPRTDVAFSGALGSQDHEAFTNALEEKALNSFLGIESSS